MAQSTRLSLLAIASTLLLSGCLEGIEAPESVRFKDASAGEAPPPIQVAIRSLSDGPATVNVGPLATEWLSPDKARLVIQPGETVMVELTASECEEGGDRVGALALSSDGALGLVRVEMACLSALDARFGVVSAHQGARIGPTEFNEAIEVPIINDRPGAFRAEVLAGFEPSAHIEVEAVVLDADGEPVDGVSPLERLREPVEFDHETAAYAAVHEFKAPSRAFDEDVEVILRIDPHGRLADDFLGNNEKRPLEGAPRLPDPLPAFHFHLVPVAMTVLRDGVEHVLTGRVPDCPAGCMAGALDMLPLPTDKVKVSVHPLLDIGTLEYTQEHEDSHWGLTLDLKEEIRAQLGSNGIWTPDAPMELQMAVAFVADDEDSVDWAGGGGWGGLAGTPILYRQTGWHTPRVVDFLTPSTVAHEVGHNLYALHAAPIGLDCSSVDDDFPEGYDGMISGDPDGGGPLRVRAAYAHRGAAGKEEPPGLPQPALPVGFLDQALLWDDVMNCRLRSGVARYVSDYHYLVTLFGAGRQAGRSWGGAWDPSEGFWGTDWDTCVGNGQPCPWRRGGPAAAAGSAKSAATPIAGAAPPEAKVHVSGYVDADGRVLEHGAHARLGSWPGRREAPSGSHILIAYDGSGMAVHEQPIALRRAFHLDGLIGRYAADIPRGDVARVEIRDGSGALLLSLDVAE